MKSAIIKVLEVKLLSTMACYEQPIVDGLTMVEAAQLSPEYALISAKVGNKYEHPTEETMQRLKERDTEVYRTDENGTVVATITTNNVSFDCEPGDYLSGVELEKREGK